MNCKSALQILYDIIDKEASTIDEKEIEGHLDQCRHCRDIFRIESSFQDFLKFKLQSSQPTSKIDTLKERILHDLDEIDCGEKE